MYKHFCLILFFFVMMSAAYAQGVPPSMTYQGYVTDLAGTPIADGNYNFTFAVYTVELGGVALWTETHPTVAVSKGLFNVILGRGNPPNPLMIAFDQQYFLGIRIGADPEMSPRVRLATSAYSFRSKIADDVKPGVITDASVAPAANIAASKLQSTVLTESEIIAGSGVTVTNAAGTLTIAASPGAVTLAGDVTGPAGANSIANNVVTQPKINAAGAAAGKFLSYDGVNMVWQTPPGGGGLTLPYSGTVASSPAAVEIENTGSGRAGRFLVNNASSTADALNAYNNSTSTSSTAIRAQAVGGRAVEAFNNSGTMSAIYAYNSGAGPVAIFGNSATSTGNIVEITKNGGSGNGINLTYGGTGGAMYISNNSSGVGMDLKQDGTGNAAYFHIDNASSSNNTLRATTISTNPNSDALEVDALAGNALDAGNNSASIPTIYASNLSATTTAPVITTNGGFRTDVSGKTTSAHYIATTNLGSGVPAAGATYKDNVVCAWARVSTTGTALSSFGCTVTRVSTGLYRVTYNNAFTSSNDACPVATAHYASGARFAMISINSSDHCDIETYNSTGVLTDSFFHIIVLGRQ